METRDEEICVIGAGPAGASAAIRLSQSGKNVLLLDRRHFPRDKVCGDAISTFAVSCLRELDEPLLNKLKISPYSYPVAGMRIYGPAMKKMEVNFAERKNPAHARYSFVNKRFHFDDLIFQHAIAMPNVSAIQGVRINHVERNGGGFILHSPDMSYSIRTKMLVVADGSESHIKKLITGKDAAENKEAFALRQYFTQVPFEGNFLEFYFIKNVLPGYVWIFPAANGETNVGIYLQKKYIKGRKLNLRHLFTAIIAGNDILKERFKNAVALTEVKAFNLRTGPAREHISGDNFVLAGDAANLADPFTGEGIGNAIFSGMRAAEVISRCSYNNNFSAKALLEYDRLVKEKLNPKMSINSGLVHLFNCAGFPQLIELACQSDFMAGIAGKTDIIRETLGI